jgi:catechol 2,3-dioxygenase
LTIAGDDSDVVALAVPEESRPLIVLQERRGIRRAPLAGALGLYHFAIRVPDRASLGRFFEHLQNFPVDIGSADHAVSESLYLRDPDRLGIEVYADRPRATWSTARGGELFMTTEPLDIVGLVTAAQGVPWTGMPKGTDMGHVHLHVGDLVAAEAFYHVALGFDKTVWTYPGARFFAAGGYHHHLGTNTWSSGRPASEDEARLQWWDVIVQSEAEAARAAQSIAAAGYRVDSGDHAWIAHDPWGTRLRLVPDF